MTSSPPLPAPEQAPRPEVDGRAGGPDPDPRALGAPEQLRLIVADWRAEGVAGVHLEYRRVGASYVVDNALTDPEPGEPPSWWQRWLLSFRAISSGDGPDMCRW